MLPQLLSLLINSNIPRQDAFWRWAEAVSQAAGSGGGGNVGLGNVLVVDPAATGTGTVGSFTDPFPTLVDAMAKVGDGDVILFVPGTHIVPPNTVFPHITDVVRSYALVGLDAATTIISTTGGNGPSFAGFKSSRISFSNLTFAATGGNAMSCGGTGGKSGSSLLASDIFLFSDGATAAAFGDFTSAYLNRVTVSKIGIVGGTASTFDKVNATIRNSMLSNVIVTAADGSYTFDIDTSRAATLDISGCVGLIGGRDVTVSQISAAITEDTNPLPFTFHGISMGDVNLGFTPAYANPQVDLSRATLLLSLQITNTSLFDMTCNARECDFGAVSANGPIDVDTRNGVVQARPAGSDFINGATWDRDVVAVSDSPGAANPTIAVAIAPPFPNIAAYTVLVEDDTGGCFGNVNSADKTAAGFTYAALKAGELHFIVQRNP